MTLSVSVIGAGNLSYYWKKNGDDITDSKYAGIDAAKLTINNFTTNDQGKYSCVVKNCNSSIESEPADLALGNSKSMSRVSKQIWKYRATS